MNNEDTGIGEALSKSHAAARRQGRPIRWISDGQGGGWFEGFTPGDKCQCCDVAINRDGDCECNS